MAALDRDGKGFLAERLVSEKSLALRRGWVSGGGDDGRKGPWQVSSTCYSYMDLFCQPWSPSGPESSEGNTKSALFFLLASYCKPHFFL